MPKPLKADEAPKNAIPQARITQKYATKKPAKTAGFLLCYGEPFEIGTPRPLIKSRRFFKKAHCYKYKKYTYFKV